MEHAAGPLHQPPGLGLHGGGHGGPELAAGRAAAPPALRGRLPPRRGRGGAEVRQPGCGHSRDTMILNIFCNITTHLQPGVLHGDAGRPGRGGHGRHQEGGAHGQVSPH